MNKKIIASVLAVASVLTVSAGALADDNITVTVNGNNVSFVEITPFICAVHSFFIIPEFSSKENPLFILFRQSNTYRACTDQYQ